MGMINIPLGAFLASSAGAIVKRVLTSLGFGIISFAAVSTALNSALSYAQSAYSGLPSYAAAFFGLAGVGTGLGMVTAALIFRASYLAMPKIGLLSQ